jgi:hypothetical protein
MGRRAVLFCTLAVAASAVLLPAQAPAPSVGAPSAPGDRTRAIAIPYRDVKAIADVLRPDLLPEPLAAARAADAESAWSEWVVGHDRDIRARVARGDDDSVLNLVFYGTTFTRLPRVTERDLANMADGAAAPEVLGQRVAALATAVAMPGDDARLRFAAAVAARHSIDPRTPPGQQALRRWLEDGVVRVVEEYRRHAAVTHDPAASSDSRSTLFSDRGLASDTTIFPAFGLEQALDALKSKAFLTQGSVRRVGVVGPGLDFIDKRVGYDFYPPQSLPPFAVVDSLRRLDLAASGGVQLITLDLSPRVNEHLEAARTRAGGGTAYVMQLPRDEAPARWTPFLAAYWESLGDRIGETVPAIAPAFPGVRNRAIRVRPEVVESIVPRELNIVVERLDGDATARFDLLVATNVLIYYDVFDQLLALANVAAMLRPGGFLLTNTPLPLVTAVPIELLGYSEVGYTDRPEGDRFFWYRKS